MSIYILNPSIHPSIGGIALDPNHFHTTNETAKQEAWKLNQAAHTVGQNVRDLKPDLVVLTSPHGIADLNKFMFFLNQAGSGPADTDNCNCPPCCYNVSIQLDYNISSAMLKTLQSLGANVSGLTAYGPPGNSEEPFPLRLNEPSIALTT